jgi:hypothetical protein
MALTSNGKLDQFKMQWAIADDDQLTSTEKAIALVILMHRNATVGDCRPSLSTIARRSSFSQRTVERTILKLENKSVLTVTSGRQGYSNRYVFEEDREDLDYLEHFGK